LYYIFIIVPGGILTEDGLNPMCLFETDEKPETVRKHVEVFEKLKRRFKVYIYIYYYFFYFKKDN